MSKPIQPGELCIVVQGGENGSAGTNRSGIVGHFVLTVKPVGLGMFYMKDHSVDVTKPAWLVKSCVPGGKLPVRRLLTDDIIQVDQRCLPAACLKPIRGD